MFHYQDEKIRSLLLDGKIGLEKENLRVTGSGHFAKTPDPFYGDKNIVKDFCENQVEINTAPWPETLQAVDELMKHTRRVVRRISEADYGEYMWPFSNPPYLTGPDDIPIAQFYGEAESKTAYRRHLERRYGKYLMTFSGIHVNFSFSEELLKADFALSGETDFHEYRDRVYLHLAEQLLRYGWILNILTAASPVMDGSYLDSADAGKDVITEYASVRSGEKGYWNTFDPVMDYSSTDAYVDSIAAYVDSGQLDAPSELYFPVRLKAKGKYTVEDLRKGWHHIELRNFDLNPLVPEGIDARDIDFVRLLLVWISCHEEKTLTREEKVRAVSDFKHSAHLHPEKETVVDPFGKKVSMTEEAARVLREMKKFYSETGLPVQDVLDFESEKIADSGKRYAFQVIDRFSGGFVEKGMEYARELAGKLKSNNDGR